MPLASQALPSDQNQKLFITADSADINSLTGIGVYQGNVVIDQGTTHVSGNTVTTHSKDNQVYEVIVEGTDDNLAIYKTTTDADKPDLVATAKTIQYYPQRHYAILLQKAHVTQGENSISGEHLEYDTLNKILKSLNSGVVDTQKPQRTTIVIEPNNLPSSTITKGNNGNTKG